MDFEKIESSNVKRPCNYVTLQDYNNVWPPNHKKMKENFGPLSLQGSVRLPWSAERMGCGCPECKQPKVAGIN